MRRFSIILISVLHTSLLMAQTPGEKQPVHIMARAQQDAIVIRIAPGSPSLWELGNKYGYVVERYTVTRGDQYLGNREREVLTSTPMKPLPLPQWEPIAEKNEFAEVAAEAIYGETFELSTDFDQDIIQVYNKAKELESRYSFALFAADVSAEVAQASGLFIRDTDVRKNERYLYRVYSAVPQTVIPSDTGFVYVSLEDYAPLPEIKDVKAQFMDKLAMVSWNTRYTRSFYSAYWVERSEDNKNFKPVTELPYVNVFPDEVSDPGLAYKIDSLQSNEKTYYYRIVGLTPFGETGPPSEVVKGEGAPALAASPAIRQVEEAGSQAIIRWEFPSDGESTITGFEIERSSDHDTGFKKVSPLLPVSARTYQDAHPEGTNYYRVKAIGKAGARSYSFPTLFQLEDSIPPLPPSGLIGQVDTAGVVTLTWKNNTEKDLYGYRVYRSNFQSSEFSQVTHSPLDTVGYREQLPLENLTRTIYYKVQAIDSRFNPSGFSTVIKLLKPDVVPPSAPVIKTWKASQDKLTLAWTPSASGDVARYQLKIRSATDSTWRITKTFFPKDVMSHEYTSLNSDRYELQITALDSSNNAGASKVLTVTVHGSPKKSLEGIRASADRSAKTIQLTWKNVPAGAAKILVYRSEKTGNASLYKSLPPDSLKFIDTQVAMNTTYTYYFKIIFQDGIESKLSNPVVLNY
jgi:fibronectin type 3 domain-containing protein